MKNYNKMKNYFKFTNIINVICILCIIFNIYTCDYDNIIGWISALIGWYLFSLSEEQNDELLIKYYDLKDNLKNNENNSKI